MTRQAALDYIKENSVPVMTLRDTKEATWTVRTKTETSAIFILQERHKFDSWEIYWHSGSSKVDDEIQRFIKH